MIKFIRLSLFSLAISSLLASNFALECGAKNKVKALDTSGVPIIHARSDWWNSAMSSLEKKNKKRGVTWSKEYADPEIFVVHHTDTSSSKSDAKQIQSIYKYHSYTKRWGDIGYNYVIGKDGQIFEGREGGNGVIAGHTSGYNEGSIGIAILGNYESNNISSAAQESLDKLIGWLAMANDIDLSKKVHFSSRNLDSAVVGHRDLTSTQCPGKKLYNTLSEIRKASLSYAASYQNFAFKNNADGSLNEFSDGKRYTNSNKPQVAALSSNQIMMFPLAGEIGSSGENTGHIYPSGTIFRTAENGQCGILEDGKIRPINSSAVLFTGYNLNNIIEISQAKWESYEQGGAADLRNGAFVRGSGNDYYLIESGLKRKLVLPQSELGLVNLNSSEAISDAEISAYQAGVDIETISNLPAGTIITSNKKDYYYIAEGSVKLKISKTVFKASFSSRMVLRVSKKALKLFKTKNSLKVQDGGVVSYKSRYYFVENKNLRRFSAKKLASTMGFKKITKVKRSDVNGLSVGSEIN
ncbi:MAG: peptidoglycan recognition family protein [Parcubacteria group bacterium]|jgi:hypothetical protein